MSLWTILLSTMTINELPCNGVLSFGYESENMLYIILDT